MKDQARQRSAEDKKLPPVQQTFAANDGTEAQGGAQRGERQLAQDAGGDRQDGEEETTTDGGGGCQVEYRGGQLVGGGGGVDRGGGGGSPAAGLALAHPAPDEALEHGRPADRIVLRDELPPELVREPHPRVVSRGGGSVVVPDRHQSSVRAATPPPLAPTCGGAKDNAKAGRKCDDRWCVPWWFVVLYVVTCYLLRYIFLWPFAVVALIANAFCGAAKRHKTPQNAAKCRKYRELAISLRGTKYLGGAKNLAPFWGARAPFPP